MESIERDFTIRQLQTHEEFRTCVDLQEETWGKNFSELVPPAMLMIGQKLGGVTAGAFDEHGRLLGLVFGITGIKDGRLAHWSHILGVRNEWRDRGVGRKLKLYQREQLLQLGVEVVYWTYDPLVARNAHLNLNRLGVEVDEYVQDMYDDDSSSKLHRGLGMDRFIVAWHIASENVKQALAGNKQMDSKPFADSPIITIKPEPNDRVIDIEDDLPLPSMIRVEVPADIQMVKAESAEAAAEWRAITRKAFSWYLENGYNVTLFYRNQQNGRCFYCLERRNL